MILNVVIKQLSLSLSLSLSPKAHPLLSVLMFLTTRASGLLLRWVGGCYNVHLVIIKHVAFPLSVVCVCVCKSYISLWDLFFTIYYYYYYYYYSCCCCYEHFLWPHLACLALTWLSILEVAAACSQGKRQTGSPIYPDFHLSLSLSLSLSSLLSFTTLPSFYSLGRLVIGESCLSLPTAKNTHTAFSLSLFTPFLFLFYFSTPSLFMSTTKILSLISLTFFLSYWSICK